MDAAFFRHLGPEIARVLEGVRLDTVFSPAPGFWTLAFSPPVGPFADQPPAFRFLLLRVHAREGALFLSEAKPANPAIPPAKAMWLRKRLRNRRILGGRSDWPRKRLALELSPGEGRWLLLSMEDDPVVLERLPEGFGDAPAWSSPEEASADPACPRSLRRALERAEPEDRAYLLDDFQSGRARGFFLNEADPMRDGPLPWPAGRSCLRFAHVFEAASEYARAAFFAPLSPPDEEPARAETRKRKRLDVLDKDRKRLEGLTLRQRFGEAVAANLSLLDPKARLGPLSLDHPELGPMPVPLDPALTVLENMERFFRLAAKGRRGLGHVERLEAEAREGRLPPRKAPAQAGGPPRAGAGQGAGGDVPLHRFRSSDGFVILRGKNSAANHKLLTTLSSPFDYWLHAEGGPGAHVIVKRDHPGQDVPETTLREAAILAALASWRAGELKADVLCALARDVRAIKGAALGRVRVDTARTLRVEPDPTLEQRLKCSS